MGFFLFLMVNAVLFVRPAEIVPALLDLPLYEALILGSLVTSLPAVTGQLSIRSLSERPASACVVGVLVSVVLSHLSHFTIDAAARSGIAFAKVLLYYLLLVGLLNSVSRLRTFLTWLLGLIMILTALALLQYHEFIDIPALASYAERQHDEVNQETGEPSVLVRLRSTGIYGNPNDLSRILAVGMLLGLYLLGNHGTGPLRFLWTAPIALCGYALHLTHSRGGLLGLMAGLATLSAARYGRKKTFWIGVLVLPVMMMLFGGRQTMISASEGTGQQRIQLWEEGFSRFARNPVFGIGMDNYVEEVGLVAHNSFVHCYTEIGFIGGTFFLGTFYLPMRSLHRLGKPGTEVAEPESQRLRPFLMAITAGTIVGMLTSSRSYSLPTYLIVGLNVAYIRVAREPSARAAEGFDSRLVQHLAVVSAIVLACFYVYVRVMVRHGPGFGH
jgi:hypothetical protein